ncbi:hypothetical protein KSP35_15190 [Aquihabitans sp. G128]|uniref:hypothetical protein n=1 Tax=Aquihabitans sp. G128 TaxID=2849779 RepID=UPI001C22D66C|nr:hypothetical protein [Aquihabitans sp. G128]QXC59718.1 hypothetical protein KSP35_15190 [Aquihabitans sp. G128]
MAEHDEAVQARVEAAVAAARERDSLVARAAEAAKQVRAAGAQVAHARLALAAEDEQVAKLSSFSLTRIVAGIRGTRDADLSREEAEREAARFAVATAESRRDAASREAAALQGRVAALGDAETELGLALAAKEAWLATTQQPGAERLVAIAARRGAIAAELREGYEATTAGQVAEDLLARAAKQLGSAESWSAYDTWFGGGMFSSAIKHDHMDLASSLVRQADGALLRLQQELADVGRSGVAQLQMGSWERTFDVFFDNIFTDLKVRDRVKGAVQKVHDARVAVRRTMQDLAQHANALTAELDALEQERRALLAG